jgi:hypothetical protein
LAHPGACRRWRWTRPWPGCHGLQDRWKRRHRDDSSSSSSSSSSSGGGGGGGRESVGLLHAAWQSGVPDARTHTEGQTLASPSASGRPPAGTRSPGHSRQGMCVQWPWLRARPPRRDSCAHACLRCRPAPPRPAPPAPPARLLGCCSCGCGAKLPDHAATAHNCHCHRPPGALRGALRARWRLGQAIAVDGGWFPPQRRETLTLGGDGVLQGASRRVAVGVRGQQQQCMQRVSGGGTRRSLPPHTLAVSARPHPPAGRAAPLTAVAISSSSYFVALHTSARRPVAGAAAARRLAVDCLSVNAMVAGWARRQL